MQLFQSKKQLFIIGFILVLLVAIPLTLYLVKQQQKLGAGAAKSTIISFDATPGTNNAVTIATQAGQLVTLPVYIDPGSGASANTISVATLQITYDPAFLELADPATCINTSGFPFQPVNKGATCTPGSALTYLAASDIRNFITTKSEIATIQFHVKPTANGTTQVTFDPNTLAGPATDKDPEVNVISQMLPATITIAAVGPTTVPSTPIPTAVPTVAPLPTSVQPTAVVPTQMPLPLCNSLTPNVAPSGTAPLTITFNATGSDANAAITKATFNFGDGTVQDVAVGAVTTVVPTIDPNAPTQDPSLPTATPTVGSQQSGQPPSSNTAQLAHTYNTAGNYQTSVTFTDSNNATSLPGNCIVQVAVNAPVRPTSAVPPTATPTVAPTGPGDTIVGIGIVGVVLTFIGGLLFFAL